MGTSSQVWQHVHKDYVTKQPSVHSTPPPPGNALVTQLWMNLDERGDLDFSWPGWTNMDDVWIQKNSFIVFLTHS